MKLASQPVEGGDSKYSTITHDNKMPALRGQRRHPLRSAERVEMPPDGYLLAEEPDASGAPPGGSNLERLASNSTEEGDTLNCGRDKVVSQHWLEPW